MSWRLMTAAAIGLLAACDTAEAPAPAPALAPSVAAPATAAPTEVAYPETYDWSWRPHGGSANLDFGDGDWAEGVSLFGLSCLPASVEVEMTWPGDEPPPARLTSGGESEVFAWASTAPLDHPVIAALSRSGALDVTTGDLITGPAQVTRLNAKAEGLTAVRAFFGYCETGATDPYGLTTQNGSSATPGS
ncbi:hypothetical protein [Brevundimonas lutea]|uniref:hypothetical protein n=1 Tax=Brevundimonas lutea TaxID=2293980 RepID=UPI00196B9E45|nr:hypothetical protein [Brevundimonas lutea]